MKNDFLIESPYDEKYGTYYFLHTDSEELFKKNKKKFGPMWKYYEYPITYKLNHLGYRMDKEMHEVDYDNYIAFFGCSNTVGIGLPLEFTFPYIIAQRAKCDYVNGAVGGCSVDFVYTNFLHFFEKVPKKPKCFVFVWPELVRTFYWYENKPLFFMPGRVKIFETNHWNNAYKSFCMEDSHMNNRFKYIRSAIKLICDGANIPFYETSIDQGSNFYNIHANINTQRKIHPGFDTFDPNPDMLHLNFARDIISLKPNQTNAHPGIYCQNSLADNFFTKMEYLMYD